MEFQGFNCKLINQRLGLDDKLIDRIYKGLYIYSLGFQNLLKKITSKANNK